MRTRPVVNDEQFGIRGSLVANTSVAVAREKAGVDVGSPTASASCTASARR